MGTILAIAKVFGANVLKMLLTKTVILWGLKLAAKQTDNKIDDYVIDVVEAGYDGDTEKFQKSVELLVEAAKSDK